MFIQIHRKAEGVGTEAAKRLSGTSLILGEGKLARPLETKSFDPKVRLPNMTFT